MSHVTDLSYWRMGFDGVVVKAASVGDPDEGKGSVVLEVEAPRQGKRPWLLGSDRWVVEVPAGQLKAAQAVYSPGELGKSLRDVEYRCVTIEFDPRYLTKSRLSAWLRRLLRRPLVLSDVKKVEFGPLYADSFGGEAV
ncbi:hypothetical protein [Streptomyces smyrnaeus]|uniref:hypothetical protein n=1 Tax=Streptomyces smyrnaeus TaxID=1387713 RepID=UPI0033F694E4